MVARCTPKAQPSARDPAGWALVCCEDIAGVMNQMTMRVWPWHTFPLYDVLRLYPLGLMHCDGSCLRRGCSSLHVPAACVRGVTAPACSSVCIRNGVVRGICLHAYYPGLHATGCCMLLHAMQAEALRPRADGSSTSAFCCTSTAASAQQRPHFTGAVPAPSYVSWAVHSCALRCAAGAAGGGCFICVCCDAGT